MNDFHVTGSGRAINQTATARGSSLRDWGNVPWGGAMSYDLYFARPKRKIAAKRVSEAYDALRRGVSDERFEPLPTEEIHGALIKAFENFEPAAKFPAINVGDGSAEVFSNAQWFSFCFRGDTDTMRDQIIELFRGFSCPVYDPQLGKLYPLDDPPRFEVATIPEIDPALQYTPEELQARKDERERARRADNPEWYDGRDSLAAEITRECSGGRWERVGLSAEWCAAVLQNMVGCLDIVHYEYDPETWKDAEPDKAKAVIDWRTTHQSNVNEGFSLVGLGFLEAIPPRHPFRDPRVAAKIAVTSAVEFFHGDWRDGCREFYYSDRMTPAESRKKLSWIDAYRAGLLMALFLDDEKAIRGMFEWPDTDLRVDDGTMDLTAADNQVQIALAFALRGEPKARLAELADRIATSKRKRAITFWSAAQAMLDGDASTFTSRFKELVALYRKSGFETNCVESIIHIDGSILWHAARRTKLALPELPEKMMDLILR
jgi:hypothetical protein